MEMNNKRKKKANENSLVIYGKVPPQAKEIEEAVIGAIMIEKNAFDKVSRFLTSACFYVDAHQKIFKAIESLNLRSETIDILTVIEEVKKNEELDIVGGVYAISKLTNMVVSSANLEAHAVIIYQKYVARELIRIAGDAVGEAYEDYADVPKLIDQVQTNLFRISRGLYKKDFTEMDYNAMQALQAAEIKVNKPEGTLTGVPSGFKEIDQCTGGFQDSDFIILAARPAVGKTAFALRVAKNAATHPIQPVGVAFFSLEMSTLQLTNRLLSAESEIPLEKIRDGDLNEIEVKALHFAANKVSNFPIYVDDSANLNIMQLKSKVKRLLEVCERTKKNRKLKKGLGLIIIDYLQLMSGVEDGNFRTKNDIIGDISRELKILAKEIEVPIIALSQMSRAIESRADKEPNLSDLRESGAIEQDADLVAFLFNENGTTVVKLAKHRNGKLRRIKLASKMEIQMFYDYVSEAWKPTHTAARYVPGGEFDEGIPEAENELSFIKK